MDNIPSATPEEEKIILKEFDAFNLTKQLDRAKAAVLTGNYSSFLGPLMCAHNFAWDRGIPTACTNGSSIWINPYWFAALPTQTRVTVIMHELMHPGRLHMLRTGNRDPKIWNYACDIRINNDLRALGYKFDGTRPWITDRHEGMAEEDIYDELVKLKTPIPNSGPFGDPSAAVEDLTADALGGDSDLLRKIHEELTKMMPDTGDILPMTDDDIRESLNAVIKADQQSRMTGGQGIGEMPGNTEYILEQFLAPVVPWEKELGDWMKALAKTRSSWRKPRRRIQHIYLPGKIVDRHGLEHLYYYWDVSGSISEKDETRFNSEVRFIKERFNPKLLTLVEFDTQIQFEKTFEQKDKFEDIKIIGKGGTCLACVREHMIQNRPTATIIFTDLYCSPMSPLPFNIPILWVVVNNSSAQVPFGKITYINS